MNPTLRSSPALFLLTAIFLLASPAARAGCVTVNAIPNKGFFAVQVNGTPLEFYGRVDHVLSVSYQQYTTGPLIVSEVVIDMSQSNQLLRIYATRPPTITETHDRAQNIIGGGVTATGIPAAMVPATPQLPSQVTQVDDGIQRGAQQATAGLVVKTYPVTTHAKTVEFAVSSEEELMTFYKNFRDLLVGREIKVNADGSTLDAKNSAGQGGSSTVSVNQIRGTIFRID